MRSTSAFSDLLNVEFKNIKWAGGLNCSPKRPCCEASVSHRFIMTLRDKFQSNCDPVENS